MMEEDNKTLWVGNLPEQATEELIYELFLQAGPLEKVRIPKDRDGRQKNFAFVTFCHEVSVPFAINLFRGTALFHKTLSLQSRGRMALLPPPIRCFGPDPALDFTSQPAVAQQFAVMTEKLLWAEECKMLHMPRGQEKHDNLALASLQGNWSHRHHPYRPKDKSLSDNRSRDNHSDNYNNNRGQHSNSWRDKRNYNNRGGSYHRRD